MISAEVFPFEPLKHIKGHFSVHFQKNKYLKKGWQEIHIQKLTEKITGVTVAVESFIAKAWQNFFIQILFHEKDKISHTYYLTCLPPIFLKEQEDSPVALFFQPLLPLHLLHPFENIPPSKVLLFTSRQEWHSGQLNKSC